jgi:hypothetical protein
MVRGAQSRQQKLYPRQFAGDTIERKKERAKSGRE